MGQETLSTLPDLNFIFQSICIFFFVLNFEISLKTNIKKVPINQIISVEMCGDVFQIVTFQRKIILKSLSKTESENWIRKIKDCIHDMRKKGRVLEQDILQDDSKDHEENSIDETFDLNYKIANIEEFERLLVVGKGAFSVV